MPWAIYLKKYCSFLGTCTQLALVEKTNIHARITHPRYLTQTRYLLNN